MAPTTTVNHPVDWRMQTIENCRFISRIGAFLSVITTKEPLGTFKAIVVRIQDGQREPLFSESAATIPEALQALHARSAEAVQNHIDANGWDFVAIPKKHWTKKAAEKDQGEGDSDVESSYSQSGSSTVTMSDASDDDLVSVGGHPSHRANESRAAKKKASKSSRKGKGRMGRSRSRSGSQSRSPSRSRSLRRNRSCSVGTVTSSSGDEDSQVSFRPAIFSRPNLMRAPNYPPGWEPGHPPGHVSLAPTNPNVMRGQQPPPPPPPPPQRPFPGVGPLPNRGQPLAMPPPSSALHAAQQHRLPAANEPQRLHPGGLIGDATGLRQFLPPFTYNTQRPNQPFHVISLPARRPESIQSNGSDGSSTNKLAFNTGPSTGYNPFTTVFSASGPPQPSTHNILLHIRWRDHINTNQIREERVLEQMPLLSVSTLKTTAAMYVGRKTDNNNSKDGANGKPPSTFGMNNNNRISWAVNLKRVLVQEGVSCVISSSIPDDASLWRIIQAIDTSPKTDKIPVIEVDVYDPACGPLDGPSAESNGNTTTLLCNHTGQSPRAYPFVPPIPSPPGWAGPAPAVNEKPPMNTRRKIEVNANTPMNLTRPQQQQTRPATTRPDFTFIPPPPPQYQWYQHQQAPQGAVRPSGAAAGTRQGQFMQGGFVMPNVNGNGGMRPMPVGISMPGAGSGNGSSIPPPRRGNIIPQPRSPQGGMKTSSSAASLLRKKGSGSGSSVSAGAGTPDGSTFTGSGTCTHGHQAVNGGVMQFVDGDVDQVQEEEEDGYFESDV